MPEASDERPDPDLEALMQRYREWCLDRLAEDRLDCAPVPPEFDALRLH